MLNFDLHVQEPFFSQLKGATCFDFRILIIQHLVLKSLSCYVIKLLGCHKDCTVEMSICWYIGVGGVLNLRICFLLFHNTSQNHDFSDLLKTSRVIHGNQY